MHIASSTANGSCSSSTRSLNVPGSDSSALHTRWCGGRPAPGPLATSTRWGSRHRLVRASPTARPLRSPRRVRAPRPVRGRAVRRRLDTDRGRADRPDRHAEAARAPRCRLADVRGGDAVRDWPVRGPVRRLAGAAGSAHRRQRARADGRVADAHAPGGRARFDHERRRAPVAHRRDTATDDSAWGDASTSTGDAAARSTQTWT